MHPYGDCLSDKCDRCLILCATSSHRKWDLVTTDKFWWMSLECWWHQSEWRTLILTTLLRLLFALVTWLVGLKMRRPSQSRTNGTNNTCPFLTDHQHHIITAIVVFNLAKWCLRTFRMQYPGFHVFLFLYIFRTCHKLS